MGLGSRREQTSCRGALSGETRSCRREGDCRLWVGIDFSYYVPGSHPPRMRTTHFSVLRFSLPRLDVVIFTLIPRNESGEYLYRLRVPTTHKIEFHSLSGNLFFKFNTYLVKRYNERFVCINFTTIPNSPKFSSKRQ